MTDTATPDDADAGDEAAADTVPGHLEGTDAGAHRALASDDHLGPVVTTHGPVTLDPATDFFERFVVSILRQQVSVESAAATRERLFDAVAVTPDGVLAAEEATLRDAGLSGAKVRYVRNVARAFEDGLSRERLRPLSNDEVRAELTAIDGVGPWTADMQLVFSLGRPDVFPVGDLGIRREVEALFGEDLTRAEMRERATRWAPYRSYASLYLWRRGDGE